MGQTQKIKGEKAGLNEQKQKKKSTFLSGVKVQDEGNSLVVVKQEEKIKVEQEESQISMSLNQQVEKVKKERKRYQKDDYIPYSTQKKVKRKVQQDARRNILPNIIHQIFCFIQKRGRSEKIVEQLILKFNKRKKEKSSSIQRFYLYQKCLKSKISKYLNESSLVNFKKIEMDYISLYTREEQELYLRISRILSLHFLNNQYKCIILTSSRMRSESRLGNLFVLRQLRERLNEIYCQIQQ